MSLASTRRSSSRCASVCTFVISCSSKSFITSLDAFTTFNNSSFSPNICSDRAEICESNSLDRSEETSLSCCNCCSSSDFMCSVFSASDFTCCSKLWKLSAIFVATSDWVSFTRASSLFTDGTTSLFIQSSCRANACFSKTTSFSQSPSSAWNFSSTLFIRCAVRNSLRVFCSSSSTLMASIAEEKSVRSRSQAPRTVFRCFSSG
mmetsp:Transcript_22574/g.57130  ORF Transcript_22574/g.57130 Transcript_22574/m.57130 type:complete len:205 (-) Transcript_22574:581-1195(-)